MNFFSKLRKRYGMAIGGGRDEFGYRGLFIRPEDVGNGVWKADILKATIKHGLVNMGQTVAGGSRKEAISMAKRTIDAMKGD